MARILIVDDNVDMLDTLEHLFMFYNFDVLRAENGEAALQLARQRQPALIVLDAMMPVMNGFEACEKLKAHPKTRHIPIIFLSATLTGELHVNRGLQAGADAYMVKPFNAKALLAKVRSLLKRHQMMDKVRRDNSQLRHDVPAMPGDSLMPSGEYDRGDPIDPLTGVYSRDHFSTRLEAALQNCTEKDEILSLLLVDVDAFKQITTSYSEQAGEFVLMKVANVLLNQTAAQGIVFRLETPQFAIVYPRQDERKAFYEGERLRSAIQQTVFFDKDGFVLKAARGKRRKASREVTVSIGTAAVTPGEGAPRLLRRADAALMRAKAKGRNATVSYSELPGGD